MPMIEIWDGPCVLLGDLLDAIPTTDEFSWSIMELWGVARDDGTDVVALERSALSSPTGLEVSGGQLRELASRLLQLNDGIVVGYRGAPPTRTDVDLRLSADVVIEAIDSTLWRIYARDSAIVDAVRRKYDDVCTVEPEIALPPAHQDT
jgi:hypothetical protein